MPQDEPNIIGEMEPQKDIILITSFPEAASPSRRAEYNECLEINCNSAISKVVVFFEGSAEGAEFYPALQHDKVVVVYINERPMYSTFMDYANNHFSGDCVVVSNGDIFFDKGSNIERALEIESGEVWALERYDWGSARQRWSLMGAGVYDSYIFIPPIKISGYDIVIGIVGCDTYLAQIMIRNGLILSNPALSITSKHKHDSKERDNRLIVGTEKWDYRQKRDYMPFGHGGMLFVLRRLKWQYLFHGIEFEVPKSSRIEDCEKISRKRFPDLLLNLLKSDILRAFRKLKRLTRRPSSF